MLNWTRPALRRKPAWMCSASDRTGRLCWTWRHGPGHGPKLEETGAASAFKDISGSRLPGLSKWTGSLGSEFVTSARFFGKPAKFFIAADSYYRSSFSSSASPSKYLNIDGYALVNARLGYRIPGGLSAFLWARNLLDKNYFEQLLPAAGNAGHYAAVLADPRTYGITFRYSL